MKKIHRTTCGTDFQVWILSSHVGFSNTDFLINGVHHYFYIVETEGKHGGIKFGTRKNFYIICTAKNNREIVDTQKIHRGRGITTLYQTSAVYSNTKHAVNGYNSEYGRTLRSVHEMFEKVVSEYKNEVIAAESKKNLIDGIQKVNNDEVVTAKRRLL